MSRIYLAALAGLALLLCGLVFALQAQSGQTSTITVPVDQRGAAIPSTLFGLFFEDINFGADGGLYPERVKNRSFEFPDPLMGWRRIERGGGQGEIKVLDQDPLNAANPHYLRLKVEPAGSYGLANEGFRGIGVRRGERYNFSVYARLVEGGPMRLRVELEGPDGKTLGATRLDGFASRWKNHTSPIAASATADKALLKVFAEGRGTLDLDMVSLYPANTWRDRPNGLRPDLVQLLRDLRPGFLRFPGGCIVEGRHLETRYQWKKTIGDIAARPQLINRWNNEFKHRPAPDYYQSFGLGFYEYFLLSEDLGAEPLPIINCGMACQFNSGELAPLDDLDEYIQDALDLIEFANGPVTSPWGRRRAEMGHPAPFNLKMIGIGNEQWGPQYIERYERFARVLKEKYPNIALVASAGPGPSGERFDFLWGKLRELKADIVDEHYYMAPAWFLANSGRYDDYPRTGPKVFAGEYAAQSVGIARPENRNNWECALAEAAFMTGLERNADVVVMSSYAPLFGHTEAWQWTPNLIWFDNLRAYGTPNYYVQKLFSTNRGTTILPVRLDGSPKNGQNGLYASASLDEKAGEVVLKIVNAASSPREVRINLLGAGGIKKAGKAIVLASSDLKAENSLAEPAKVAPVEKRLDVPSGEFQYALAPSSVTVLRVGYSGK
jgi:alpha-N-arabinofuranosidase